MNCLREVYPEAVIKRFYWSKVQMKRSGVITCFHFVLLCGFMLLSVCFCVCMDHSSLIHILLLQLIPRSSHGPRILPVPCKELLSALSSLCCCTTTWRLSCRLYNLLWLSAYLQTLSFLVTVCWNVTMCLIFPIRFESQLSLICSCSV